MIEKEIRIGTRGSQLALWQANWVKSILEKEYPDFRVTITKIKTKGDKILDVPLAKVGGKGLFVKEIEEQLLEDKIDVAVHSMKDVPTELPEELIITAIPEREDPRDIIISKNNTKFCDLPIGANIGTSSLRRQAQLLHKRPDFKMLDLRGNLDTRIKKLISGDFDAVIVAAAGVKRMGWGDKISDYIPTDVMLPAIGQGALGLEIRKDDKAIKELIKIFNHQETFITVSAERSLLKKLEGGCQVPIAAYGVLNNGNLTLQGVVASVDGKRIIREEMTGCPGEAETLGIKLAEKLLDLGAKEILDEVYKCNL